MRKLAAKTVAASVLAMMLGLTVWDALSSVAVGQAGGVPYPLSYVSQTYYQTPSEVTCGAAIVNPGYVPGDVRRFGATGNGSTDDTSAIQNTINCLPATGGVVQLAAGSQYKISSPLVVGNGSASAASTTYGIIIRGGASPAVGAGGYTSTSGSSFVWAGGTSQAVLTFQGPLAGFGVENLLINCNSAAGVTGLQLISAQYGRVRSVNVNNCANGIYSNTVATIPAGLSNSNSMHNEITDVAIAVPNVAGNIAVFIGGNNNGNTCYTRFTNLKIQFPGSAVATIYGLYIGASDNVTFYNVHYTNVVTNTTAVTFDYTTNAQWPADSFIEHVDFGGAASTSIANVGTPSGAKPNRIWAVSGTNGTTNNPNLANLDWESFDGNTSFNNGGGITLGSPTGGAEGASTINAAGVAAGGYFVNGTALALGGGFGSGLALGSPTGGQEGGGTINVLNNYYLNGVAQFTTGSFSATYVSGCTTGTATASANYTKIGNQVTIRFSVATLCTTNTSTGVVFTGVPAAIQPPSPLYVPIIVQASTGQVPGIANFIASSNFSISATSALGANSGLVSGGQVTYIIN
jgi:hypothetical protein